MAAKKLEKFTIEIDLKGLEDLTGLTRSLKQLDKAFKPLNQTGIKSLNNNIKTTIALVPKSVNQFKQKERTLKALRNEVKIGGTEFKKLGAAIDANNAINAIDANDAINTNDSNDTNEVNQSQIEAS